MEVAKVWMENDCVEIAVVGGAGAKRRAEDNNACSLPSHASENPKITLTGFFTDCAHSYALFFSLSQRD